MDAFVQKSSLAGMTVRGNSHADVLQVDIQYNEESYCISTWLFSGELLSTKAQPDAREMRHLGTSKILIYQYINQATT